MPSWLTWTFVHKVVQCSYVHWSASFFAGAVLVSPVALSTWITFQRLWDGGRGSPRLLVVGLCMCLHLASLCCSAGLLVHCWLDGLLLPNSSSGFVLSAGEIAIVSDWVHKSKGERVQMGETIDLSLFLLWLITPGAGLIAAYIAARIPAIAQLAEDLKRLVTGAMAAVIGVGAYLGQIAMEYVAAPADWRGWVEALFAVAFIAAGMAELSRVIYVRVACWINRRKMLRAPP